MAEKLSQEFQDLFKILHRMPNLFEIYNKILPHEHVLGNGWVLKFSPPLPDAPLLVDVDKKNVDDKRLVYDAILTIMLPVTHFPSEDAKLKSSTYAEFSRIGDEQFRLGNNTPYVNTNSRNDLIYTSRGKIVHWSIIRPTPTTAQSMILEVRDTPKNRELMLELLKAAPLDVDTGSI